MFAIHPPALSRELRLGVLSVGIALVGWEALVATRTLDPLVASSPSRIAAASVVLFGDGRFLNHLRTSALEFILGFLVALVLGIGLGIPAGWYARLRYAVSPAASAAYAAPRIAVLPLLVLWFGFGPVSTTMLVFLGAFFVIFLIVMVGAASVDATLIRAARAFSAGDLRIFRSIVLPAVFPSIVTGLRLAIAPGLAGVVVGEMYAASAGLGYFIHITASTLQIDKMFVALLLLGAVGLILNILVTRLENRFAQWRPDERSTTPAAVARV